MAHLLLLSVAIHPLPSQKKSALPSDRAEWKFPRKQTIKNILILHSFKWKYCQNWWTTSGRSTCFIFTKSFLIWTFLLLTVNMENFELNKQKHPQNLNCIKLWQPSNNDTSFQYERAASYSIRNIKLIISFFYTYSTVTKAKELEF